MNFINTLMTVLKNVFLGTTQKLLQDERFCISEDFFRWISLFRNFEKYEISSIELGKITYGNTPLCKTAPYLYLEGNVDAYKDYCAYHQRVLHIDMNYQRFDKLISSVEKNGYDEKFIIVLKYNNSLMDGQHRACCLMHKYGPEHKIKVLRLKLKKRNVLQKILRYFAGAKRTKTQSIES